MNLHFITKNLFLFLTSLALAAVCVADDYTSETDLITEIYKPSNVPAEKLKSIVFPLYTQSIFSTDSQHLIIRSKQPKMNEILSLLSKLDHPARTFFVQISNHSHETEPLRTYSTTYRSSYLQNFSMLENSTITIVKEHEDQELRGPTPIWFQVDNEPEKMEFLSLSLQSAEDYAYLTIKRRWLENGQFQTVSQQINVAIGEWVAINKRGTQKTISGKHSRFTQRDRRLQLFIKVDTEE